MAATVSQSTTLSSSQMPVITDIRSRERPSITKADIEHKTVTDDPRKWSKARKATILTLVSAAAMIAGLGANIYNPAISQVEADLHASSSDISLSLSLFILIQGAFPLIWTAFSEIYGRKVVYIGAIALATLGGIVAATSKTIGVLIGMRCVQAAGSSAVMSIGAATLADIYEPSERGTMMGVYYCAPLLGPSLGPIIGGLLTQAFSWRATFWFYGAFCGVCCIAFLFFPDTFRRERSLTYQLALVHAKAQQEARGSETSSLSHVTAVAREIPDNGKREKDRQSPLQDDEKSNHVDELNRDVEAQDQVIPAEIAPIEEINLSLKDVNPVGPIVSVLRRLNNFVILFASGMIFAFSYSISYTCARTLENDYGFDALDTGLVLLSLGVGSIAGSILGGRWSDYTFSRLKAAAGGKGRPEMRLESAKLAMPFLPLFVIAYGWVCEEHVHVASICVMLFFAGFFSIAIYSSTLAYIVDANTGRSSSAVACNSCFRGGFAFIATEIAVPLQNSIGDGGMYTFWAGLLGIAEVLIVLVWWKGGQWRDKSEAREMRTGKSL